MQVEIWDLFTSSPGGVYSTSGWADMHEGRRHLSVNGALSLASCLLFCLPSQACRGGLLLRPPCFISPIHLFTRPFQCYPSGASDTDAHAPLSYSSSRSLRLCWEWRNVAANPSCLWMTRGLGRGRGTLPEVAYISVACPLLGRFNLPQWRWP